MLDVAAFVTALFAYGAALPVEPAAPDAQEITVPGRDLAADLILSGQKEAALNQLEQQARLAPNDPAILINLGIAYAHVGQEERARDAFKRALATSAQQEFDTADGRTMNADRLARQALQMLSRGEFRATSLAGM